LEGKTLSWAGHVAGWRRIVVGCSVGQRQCWRQNVVRVDLRLVSCQDREMIDLAYVCLVLKMKAPRSSETSRAIGPMTQRHIP